MVHNNGTSFIYVSVTNQTFGVEKWMDSNMYLWDG